MLGVSKGGKCEWIMTYHTLLSGKIHCLFGKYSDSTGQLIWRLLVFGGDFEEGNTTPDFEDRSVYRLGL